MNDFGRQAQHPTADRHGWTPTGAAPGYPTQHAPAGQPGSWQPQGGPPPRPPVQSPAASAAQYTGPHGAPGPQGQRNPQGQYGGPGPSYGPGYQPGPQGPGPQGPGSQGPGSQGQGGQWQARQWTGPQQPGPQQTPGREWPGPATPPWPAGPDAIPPGRPGHPDAARPDQPRPDQPRQDSADGTPARPRRSRRNQWIGAAVLLIGLGGLGWYAGQSAPAAAVVGDCVTQTGTDDISIVGCGEASAQFRVVGRLEDRTMIDAGLFACSEFADASSSFWQGEAGPGELGMVLCLAPVTA